MICNGNRIVLSYFKLKEGSTRGKPPIILLKRIIVKSGIVEKKVDYEEVPHNPYNWACTIALN